MAIRLLWQSVSPQPRIPTSPVCGPVPRNDKIGGHCEPVRTQLTHEFALPNRRFGRSRMGRMRGHCEPRSGAAIRSPQPRIPTSPVCGLVPRNDKIGGHCEPVRTQLTHEFALPNRRFGRSRMARQSVFFQRRPSRFSLPLPAAIPPTRYKTVSCLVTLCNPFPLPVWEIRGFSVFFIGQSAEKCPKT